MQNPYGAPRSNILGDMGLVSTIIGGAALLGAVPMLAFSGTKLEFFPLPPAPPSAAPNPSEI